jgi:hypothetical protein
MAVQNFMSEKIKLSIFNNTFIKDDESNKVKKSQVQQYFVL